jgi:hypothetical protein
VTTIGRIGVTTEDDGYDENGEPFQRELDDANAGFLNQPQETDRAGRAESQGTGPFPSIITIA